MSIVSLDRPLNLTLRPTPLLSVTDSSSHNTHAGVGVMDSLDGENDPFLVGIISILTEHDVVTGLDFSKTCAMRIDFY